jgi:short-subunit dehydrogenase
MGLGLKKLPNQVMVLTGATSGIGLATARMAAQRGAKLVLAARNTDALNQLAEELGKKGASIICVVADVGNEQDVQRIAQAAIQRFGKIDTWVNNAGVSIFGRLEEVTIEDQRRLFETNFWGVVYGSLTAAQYLKQSGGALINIGSGFSDRAAPLQGIYSASKHAVKGFTDSLRMELKKEGASISVTLVKPASVNSMLTEHAKNYLDVQPRLPPPLYAPEVVAKAILYAAEHPIRDIYAGSAAKLLGMGAHYMPTIVDWGMERLMFRLQKTHKPPYPKDRHNLHSASMDMRESSATEARVFKRSWYTEAVMLPKVGKAALIGGLTFAGLLCARQVFLKKRTHRLFSI